MARRDFINYVEYVHKMQAYRHQREWADAFVNPSPVAKHTLIVAPPGSSKTSWASVFYPCFALGVDPGLHIGLVSSTARQAFKLSIVVRDIITEAPDYRAVFPHAAPDKTKGWARDQWYLKRPRLDDKDPSMIAAGLFGPILGARLDLLILDDVIDEEAANSEVLRRRARNWVRNTAMSRLLPKTGRAICLLTRWPGITEDLVAEFAPDAEWNVIRMPAINYWGDNGALWPEWVPLEFLLKERERDPLTFEAIYQGNPHVAAGDLFKRDWWVWSDGDVWPAKFERIIQAWDTAFKKGKKNDYSACVTLGLYKGSIFVLSMLREKLSWPELVKAANQQYDAYHPSVVLIEDSASGQTLLQQLQVQSDPMIPVVPSVRGAQDKRAFVQPVTGYVAGRRVVLPKGASWTNHFVNSCAEFNPDKEQKDDDVMAFAHGVRYLTKTSHMALTDECWVSSGAQPDSLNPTSMKEIAGGSLFGFSGPGRGIATHSSGGHWFDNL